MKKEAQKVLKYRNGGGVGWAGMGSEGGYGSLPERSYHSTVAPKPAEGRFEEVQRFIDDREVSGPNYQVFHAPGNVPKPEIDKSLSGVEIFEQIFGRSPGSLWTERDKSFGEQIEKENKIAEFLGSDKPPHLMVIPRGGYSEEDIMEIERWKALPVRQRLDTAVKMAERFFQPMESEFADALKPQASMPPFPEPSVQGPISGPISGYTNIGGGSFQVPDESTLPGWKDSPNNPVNLHRRRRVEKGLLGEPNIGNYEDLYEDAKWGWDYQTGKHTGDNAAYQLFDPGGINADQWLAQEIGAPPTGPQPPSAQDPEPIAAPPAGNWEARYNELLKQFEAEKAKVVALENRLQLFMEKPQKPQPQPISRPGLIDALQKPVQGLVGSLQPKPPGSSGPTIFMGDHPSGQTEWVAKPKPQPKPESSGPPYGFPSKGPVGRPTYYPDHRNRPTGGAGGGFAQSSWGGRFAEGGEVEDWRKDLDKELEGMGEEGKSYLKDKLHGKEYKGELSFEDQRDLDKELDGLSPEGKEYLKEKLGDSDPFKEFKKKLKVDKDEDVEDKDVEDEESIGELMAYSEEGYKDGGEAKNWIKGAVKKPGALRATAKKEGLIKGGDKLSGSDLKKLAALASKKDNKLLAKRVALAKTFAKMRK
jgi:hypothetical protein